MHNCDFRIPILCFYPSKHHPKPLSIFHSLREDARIDVETRAGRVGHVEDGVGELPAFGDQPGGDNHRRDGAENLVQKPLTADQPRLYLAKVLTAMNQSRRPIFLPSARLRGK